MVHIIPSDMLTALVHRLEAATSRLEDIASATIEPPKSNGASPSSAPVAAPLPPTVPATSEPVKPKAEPLPESVEEFDSFISGPVKKFVTLSEELGGPLAQQVRYSCRKCEPRN